MSQLLSHFNSSILNIIMAVCVLSVANVGLVLALLRNHALLRRSQKSMSNIKLHIKQELEIHLSHQRQLEEKIGVMECQLKDYEERFTQKGAMIENLSGELNAFKSTKKNAEVFLAGIKNELLRGVGIVEDLEARFTTIDILGSRPPRRETTLSFVAQRQAPGVLHAKKSTPKTPAGRARDQEAITAQRKIPELKFKLSTAGNYYLDIMDRPAPFRRFVG